MWECNSERVERRTATGYQTRMQQSLNLNSQVIQLRPGVACDCGWEQLRTDCKARRGPRTTRLASAPRPQWQIRIGASLVDKKPSARRSVRPNEPFRLLRSSADCFRSSWVLSLLISWLQGRPLPACPAHGPSATCLPVCLSVPCCYYIPTLVRSLRPCPLFPTLLPLFPSSFHPVPCMVAVFAVHRSRSLSL